MANPKALVLCGDGINCDLETQQGLELAGFDAHRVHTSEFLSNPDKLFDFELMALPGGFSFGDEIASGKVLAIKLRHQVKGTLYRYIERGKLVLGICNGFQVLTQLGLLPASEENAPRTVTLDRNIGDKFINRWVQLIVDKQHPSAFFEGLERIELPIRHGEGRLRLSPDASDETLETVRTQATLRYSEDVNGSFDQIAGLTNKQGNVLGLMPHPEAFVRSSQHPNWKQRKASMEPDGLAILKNAYKAIK